MSYHRKNNNFGYHEKWLHCLLIEKIQDGSLSGLDLEVLYYETPVGKVKRNKRFGREYIDILAKERHSKALVVVEVKKQGEDLNSAVSQGLSYVEWLAKYKGHLKPRIAQLGWDADIGALELIVLTPDADFKNTVIDENITFAPNGYPFKNRDRIQHLGSSHDNKPRTKNRIQNCLDQDRRTAAFP